MKYWTRISLVVGLIMLISTGVFLWQRSRHTVEMVTVTRGLCRHPGTND